MRWLLALVSITVAAAGNETSPIDVKVTVDTAEGLAAIRGSALTSITIDVCALKQKLNFSNPLLQTLTSHLGPQAVLRVGGTDQNTYSYNMSSYADQPACTCGHQCTMTAAYWDQLQQFVDKTGLRLIFGLSPQNVENAVTLVKHTATRNYSRVLAYSWGNEQTGDKSLAHQYRDDMSKIRKALLDVYPEQGRPLIVGADTGIGPRRGTVPANMSMDQGIQEHLEWVDTFTSVVGDVTDAVSWHTYDYRSSDIGGIDHHPLPYPAPAQMSNFFKPAYHHVVEQLLRNITRIVKKNIPSMDKGKIWLTETNSLCHQGIYNVSNAFANSLWLVQRFGSMASQGVQLMARQSLIGYNYSLLGNFPAEPIVASPDYFTTLIYNKLVGSGVLTSSSTAADIRTTVYCSAEYSGGLTVTVVNLNQQQDANISLLTGELRFTGVRSEYLLTPSWSADAAASAMDRTSSRLMLLNGKLLQIGTTGTVPEFRGVLRDASQPFYVPALSIMFAVYKDASVQSCK